MLKSDSSDSQNCHTLPLFQGCPGLVRRKWISRYGRVDRDMPGLKLIYSQAVRRIVRGDLAKCCGNGDHENGELGTSV